jgi:hypothetical protein
VLGETAIYEEFFELNYGLTLFSSFSSSIGAICSYPDADGAGSDSCASTAPSPFSAAAANCSELSATGCI